MGAANVIRNALKIALSQLSSNGSIESKIIDVVGTVADTYALELDNTKNVINNALANQKVTGIEYYRQKAIAFQLGDSLSYDPVNFGGYYPQITPEKQIIKQAYITGAFPDFYLLVNKIGSDGHLDVLTEAEMNGFTTYFAAFQPIGMHLNLASLMPAVISDPNMVIYVQAGSDASTIANQINNAFTAHESILRRSNIVALTELEDIIQSVAGVRAIGWDKPVAIETTINDITRTVQLTQGLFALSSGAFTFGTEITSQMIKTLP